MNKLISMVLVLMMTLSITSCGRSVPQLSEGNSPPSEPAQASGTSPAKPEKKVVVNVFAAASMTETLEEIADMYAEVAPNVTLVCNFDSSGTLKTQIQEGAECDLFISAGQKQMDQLDISTSDDVNTDGLDFVLESSRINLLENKVVLVVPKENPKNVDSFDSMAALLEKGEILLAMGNSDVPAGQYTQKILSYYKLDEEKLAAAGNISYGTNVKEVTIQVSEASVNCGIIYCTDAFSAKLDIVDYATAEMCGRVIYPAAVLKNSKNEEAASFLEYLTTKEAMAVFEKVGFSKP